MNKRIALGLLIVLAIIFAVFLFWPAGMNTLDRPQEANPADETGAIQGTADANGPSIEAVDFASLQLGTPLAGSEMESSIADGQQSQLGTLRSYVACASSAQACDPEQPSDGALYTYVLEVTPAAQASAFKTARAVPGFNGVAGFDAGQAEAAVGGDSALVLQCSGGVLMWAINGGDLWSAGAPVTLFWQSSLPPEQVTGAVQLVGDGELGQGTSAFPAGEGATGCG